LKTSFFVSAPKGLQDVDARIDQVANILRGKSDGRDCALDRRRSLSTPLVLDGWPIRGESTRTIGHIFKVVSRDLPVQLFF
jgi:hypothetical protein